MNIQLKKLYYKYINTTDINHYKLLILTEEYINIGRKYFNKYPTAEGWINLNQELFNSNKEAEIEYNNISKRQIYLKNEFFTNHEIICKNDKNKESNICSDYFKNFYVLKKYHYEQFTENIIENIIIDINNIEIKKN
jgi:hypothetical protein